MEFLEIMNYILKEAEDILWKFQDNITIDIESLSLYSSLVTRFI